MAEPPRVLVDTSVLIEVLTRSPQQPELLDPSLWVFEAAEQGIHRIVLPALVIAEVFGAHPMRGVDLPGPEREQRVQRAREWFRDADFLVVDVDQRLAEAAGQLSGQLQLKGGDAIMVAAAVTYGCGVLYSWDQDHLNCNGRVAALEIRAPRRMTAAQQSIDVGDGSHAEDS